MQFEIEGPAPKQLGEVVQTADAIRRGDVVWFERIAPGEVLMRVVPPEQVAAFAAAKYRVDRGAQPGTIKLMYLE